MIGEVLVQISESGSHSRTTVPTCDQIDLPTAIVADEFGYGEKCFAKHDLVLLQRVYYSVE